MRAARCIPECGCNGRGRLAQRPSVRFEDGIEQYLRELMRLARTARHGPGLQLLDISESWSPVDGAQLFVRRKAPFEEQVLAQHHPRRIVDVEDLDSHDTGLSLADQDRVVPAEVALPALFARVEERIEFAA